MSRQQNNAFTMHSNACIMLRKNVAAMPMCMGAVRVYTQENLLIHLFINQINLSVYEEIYLDVIGSSTSANDHERRG